MANILLGSRLAAHTIYNPALSNFITTHMAQMSRISASPAVAGPLEVLNAVAENTSLHGVPNAYRARSKTRKIIWSALSIASFVLCLCQVVDNFKKYTSNPTASTVGSVSGHESDFPAVTFCNMNPVRLSRINPSLLIEWRSDPSTSRLAFLRWYSEINLRDRIHIGHTLEGMLLYCGFASTGCLDSANFSHMGSPEYGNCYTFNGGDLPERHKVSGVGPNFGLELELYIDQKEYLPFNTRTAAGIRLLVHNQTYMPMLKDAGMTLAPGFACNIGITRADIQRAKSPYGKCADVRDEELATRNGYLDMHPYVHYTYQACSVTCYQQNVIRHCDCGDQTIPMNGRAFSDFKLTDTKPCQDQAQMTCLRSVLRNHTHGLNNCTDVCPVMCLETIYNQKLSFGQWPSQAAANLFFEHLESGFGEEILMNNSREAWIRQNVVKVLVYFERLDYETMTTASSYSAIDLLSAQGGQVSLWLGLSVLTLFEMVELMWDLFVSIVAAGSKKLESHGARETGNRKLGSGGTGKNPPTTENTND